VHGNWIGGRGSLHFDYSHDSPRRPCAPNDDEFGRYLGSAPASGMVDPPLLNWQTDYEKGSPIRTVQSVYLSVDMLDA
jgi:hypothetical protein